MEDISVELFSMDTYFIALLVEILRNPPKENYTMQRLPEYYNFSDGNYAIAAVASKNTSEILQLSV